MTDGDSSPPELTESSSSDRPTDEPLDPSGIAQFVEHNRCPRYLKQRTEPGDEPNARDWKEAFGLMNIALLGNGQEFEARQLEALATNATKVIGPQLDDRTKTNVPDITIDETWADSARGRTDQLHAAIEAAAALSTNPDDPSYLLCYQAPLGGQLGDQDVWGEIDCLVLRPTTEGSDPTGGREPTAATESSPDTDIQPATGETSESPTAQSPQSSTTCSNSHVDARVLEIKNASEQKPSHRVQVAIYSALLEQTLGEGSAPPCRIQASVLTQQTAATPGEPLDPFDIQTFSRPEWELFVTRLLAADGPIDEVLTEDLDDLPFTLDPVCNNCAYREACATRAVEDPTSTASLALLGLGPNVQHALQDAGVPNIRELSELLPHQDGHHPTDDPPTVDLPADQRRKLEKVLPCSVFEIIQRAQALRGELDPEYPSYTRPPALPGKDWIPLPDDRLDNWSNIDGADSGELIHVALFVRPDTEINRIASLGACVYAEAHDEYITIGEIIDVVPDDPDVATDAEAALFERFLDQLFETIETVGTELGDPEQSVIHCYTYSEYETEALAEGLDRHVETLDQARAMRSLCSLDPDGHTDIDQSLVSPVQPILNEHFALTHASQGLLTVTEQFIPTWTVESFDPLDARGDDPPLRAIFYEQFLNQQVAYLNDEPGIRLNLSKGPLGEGPTAEIADVDNPDPDGWYPLRKRSGGQFPLEYIWAVTPAHPDDNTPRLTPDIVDEWALDDDDKVLYRQEINQFYYRTRGQSEPLQRSDVEYLVERLSYALMRLVESIPYKDAYHPKESLDATRLAEFELPVTRPTEAARDYLRMEFGAKRDRTLSHYRKPLRKRARSGRSIPIRCTDIEEQDDGSVTIEGELAFDLLFEDEDTASRVARQVRLRSGDGPGSGSWRLLTRVQSPASSTQSATENTDPSTGSSPSQRVDTEAQLTVDDPEAIKHSPPVLVEDIDTQAGTVSLTTFSHRFQRNGSEFRVDHCGWECPVGSNVSDPQEPVDQRPGYVADRQPVWIDAGEVYMLDPMIDDFGAPKADRALKPDTVEHNALWQHLQAIRRTGTQQPAMVADPDAVESFLDTLADADGCLEPNDNQQSFIEAVDRPLVPLQGPPGTGKTSGATAPALLARAYARQQHNESFVGVVVAPSHEAVDAVLDGTVESLENWRRATNGLNGLQLVRVLPTTPPSEEDRADAITDYVEVSYANYHSTDGKELITNLASEVCGSTDNAEQCLLFTTPSTLYRTLGIIAETLSSIDGDTAPAAMRHFEGLADVVCVDEASMLDIPQLLLAGSVVKPEGQTLLVGDHRQLPTVTETDWDETLREPLIETKAYLSALEYVHWINQTVSADDTGATMSTDGGIHQAQLSEFDGSSDSDSEPETGTEQATNRGDRQ